MEPEGLFSCEKGKRGGGDQAAISISWDGGGGVWANFFNALVGIGWRKKIIGGHCEIGVLTRVSYAMMIK